MNVMVVGASSGLGLALTKALVSDGHSVVGVSRTIPCDPPAEWICADFDDPFTAAEKLNAQSPPCIDMLIWNLGRWEPTAFTDEYDFSDVPHAVTAGLVATNVTAPIMAVQTLLPRLLASKNPRIVLTGSTSALPQSGRPEVTFGATKTALNGIADALREGYREKKLGVTTLQLGYLNTEDGLEVPLSVAAERGGGKLVPVHDVVAVIRTLISLSPASFVREIVLPAISDERF